MHCDRPAGNAAAAQRPGAGVNQITFFPSAGARSLQRAYNPHHINSAAS